MLKFPSLLGVIHLPALPGSPGFEGGDAELASIEASAARDAEALAKAGFDAAILENFGDAPFEPERVAPVTVAAMTRCALAVRRVAPALTLGINVLRNDAEAALGIAVATGASMVRINVHTGARVTDQGLIQGRAHHTTRPRRTLHAEHVQLLCDVDVKHSAPLAPRALADEAADLAGRGRADAVLVTGRGTGHGIEADDLSVVLAAVNVPVLVASGVTLAALPSLRAAHGVIVGSCLRASGRAGDAIAPELARTFAEAFRASRTL